MLPVSVRDWLPEDHLAWFVLEAVERLDLAAFYGAYRADGHGRAAHDPGMMVALLVYSYAVGERSSRRIERACQQDVAYRVITANRVPDHVTVARFRVRHAAALAELLVGVLALCAKAGMVKVGTVAVDGTKMHANAGLSANRGLAAIEREVEKILAEADEIDRAEDQLFGDERGDELPVELRDRASRRARLERAKEELDAEQQALKEDYEKKLARREEHLQQTGRGAPGRPPKPPGERAVRRDRKKTKPKRNITDPESRVVNSRGRLIQGYNAQALVGENRVIIAAEVTNSPNDSNELSRMLTAAERNLEVIDHTERIKVALADNGYWNKQEIKTVEQDTRTLVIVPTKADHRDGERQLAPPQGPEAEKIEKILASAAGKRLYKRRAEMVEPVFAHTKHTRGIDRFARRGLQPVSQEWKLIAAGHNLLKLFRWAPQPA